MPRPHSWPAASGTHVPSDIAAEPAAYAMAGCTPAGVMRIK
ncbi:MAG: hypothetical protein WCC45_14635 [Paeniglutamicibacter sp.]